MAEILEVFHLPHQDGVTQVNVRRGRIEAGLDHEGLARLHGPLQLGQELTLLEDLNGSFLQVLDLFRRRAHGSPSYHSPAA